jgi:cysteine synthase A
MNQNCSNFSAHFDGTGPEIWRQTNGEVAAFVSGAGQHFNIYYRAFRFSLAFLSILALGTGGTIAGTGRFLKSVDPNILVVLADPEGSGLYNKVLLWHLIHGTVHHVD